MIKHIVMWRFADHAAGADKATNLELAKQQLLSLDALVPGMLKLEAVVPQDPFEHSYDLLLYSEFTSVEALKAYAGHPDHLAVGRFITEVRTERVCVDYEV
ncbi:Dabb family protein [Propionicimonas sp.]|uniref:Dabb family protein n=1 Tax=Propionicimonas sp. TaxID=1955623 RepID=UPI00182F8CCF|nr:Dabb family protein [Propionicimonas sp.]MBU3976702.1 Dabb family protein [Actinomycetota bacterium]MBA3019768.1 Dabb family protein [Propionicimonas sp.]MBU3986797.1 Dabb family protein [Actinomycetota bacterium]MBU4006709.1 Dabb family protein [Actinomycetota bacterium]MBU4065409.1 Dabb family protein [Actinomycetota bacterium]